MTLWDNITFEILISDHPCTLTNGGCSHFCVGTSTSYKCDCPDGMSLNITNNKTCLHKRKC